MKMQSVQKLDGQGVLAGIKASRLWTLVLLWTVRGCPELDARGALDRSGVSRVWTLWPASNQVVTGGRD